MKKICNVALALGALLVGFATAQDQETAWEVETLRLEISEDMTRFAFDESKTFEDGLPAHGSGFVTVGYVYPEGTLNGSDGVNPDGSPEFPDAVLGEWICYGYMIHDAGHADGTPWVISTQVINLEPTVGERTIVTIGYELAGDTPVLRAVSGGTGPYREARGEVTQVMTGLNATEGVVLEVEIEIARWVDGGGAAYGVGHEPLAAGRREGALHR
jgi:hypothetical protein